MKNTHHDLIVLGGGPAGSSAAAAARRRDMSVCIVEKETFPRFRIGESLLPAGNVHLVETGVWEKVVSAGFIEKRGARFMLPDGTGHKRIDFANGIAPGPSTTFQVERSRFDQILLEHARLLGAEVKMPATAACVTEHADHVAVKLQHPAGDTETITARYLINAAGRGNPARDGSPREFEPQRFPRRMAVYSHFRNVLLPCDETAGDTIVVRMADGWFWLIPINAEKTSVGLVVGIESIRAADGDWSVLFHQAVRRSSVLRRMFSNAEPVMDLRVTADYSYFRRNLARRRVICAGDAGGFLDPVFSSGVYLAIFSSLRAVDTIAQAHAADRCLTKQECRSFTREIKARAGVFGKLISTFYDNDSISVFLTPNPPLDLEGAITSIIAGQAELTWKLRWRYACFLLVCRLNKFIRLVPRLPVDASAAVGAPAR